MSMKSTVFPDPSSGGRTRQSEKDSCDVNLIVRMHARGGVSNHVVTRVAEYGFVPGRDFRECMQALKEAEELFLALPAETRRFFDESPAKFVDFVSDSRNREKLIELGLVMKKEPPAPVLGSAENPIVTRSVDAGTPAS